MTKVDGYINDISSQVQSIIDDLETRLVNENLAQILMGDVRITIGSSKT